MNARFFISVLKPHQTNRDISRRHLAAAALFALTDWLSPPFGVESLPQGGIFFFGGGGTALLMARKKYCPLQQPKMFSELSLSSRALAVGAGWSAESQIKLMEDHYLGEI